MSEKTGIILNNQMDDFATPGLNNIYGLIPTESNYIVPGKKPLSSMSPTLVFRVNKDPSTMPSSSSPGNNDNSKESSPRPRLGPLVMALGASGGPKIITAVAQVLINFVALGMPLYESVIHARIHDQLIYRDAAVAGVETRKLNTGEEIVVSQRTRDALERRNHVLREITGTGVVQAVAVDFETNTLDAVCDVRKGGSPDGY